MKNSIFMTLLAMMMSTSSGATEAEKMNSTRYFPIGEKRLAYEDSGGEGSIVFCIPGLGDTRRQFRKLSPLLQQAGFRVVVVDPRGQGESDVGWPSYAADAVGQDAVKMIDTLFPGREVILIGGSAGAGAAAWAAAELQERIAALMLIGPFVRDVKPSFFQALLLRIGFSGPWAARAWTQYYKSLFASNPPSDLDLYLEELKKNLGEPGRLRALKSMIFASKEAVERRLGEVVSSTLVVMGTEDHDFKSPEEEANLVAGLTRGKVEMVAGAGHYPHIENPEMIRDFALNWKGWAK